VTLKFKFRYRILRFLREIEWHIRRLAEYLDVCYVCEDEADEWCESCGMRVCFHHAMACEDCFVCNDCGEALMAEEVL
jgi:hypothetical protein